jgi:hypothetical protein
LLMLSAVWWVEHTPPPTAPSILNI